MEAAKNAVSGLLHRSGKEKTDVEEIVNSAVTAEIVKPHRHEETTEAIDREVHEHHYHTTVLPLSHQESLPEKHTHNMLPVEERQVRQEDPDGDKQKVAVKAAQFKNSSTTHEIQRTSSQAPTVTGERRHHHVHEIVQPVVFKETVRPEVVHTTAPIREKILAPSEIHGLSMLPPKTIEEFTKMGGSLTETSQRFEEFEGDPKPYNPKYQKVRYDVDKNFEAHDGLHDLESTGHLSTPPASAGFGTSAGVAENAADLPTTFPAQHSTSNSETSRKQNSSSDNREPPADATNLRVSADIAPQESDQAVQTSSNMNNDQPGSRDVGKSEPTNLVEDTADASESQKISADDNVQHASTLGDDPALVKNSGKMTGDGVDGSHSAVFGLTEDGHKS